MIKLLLVLFLLLVPADEVFSAVTFDAQSETDITSTTSSSHNHTVGGGCADPLITVEISTHGNTVVISSMTIGGTAGSLLDNQTVITGTVQFWYYRAGVSTGTNAIAVTFSTNQDAAHISSRSWCNVNQASPLGTVTKTTQTTPTDQAPSVSVSTAANDMAIDFVLAHHAGGFPSAPGCSAHASQTEDDNYTLDSFFCIYASREAASGSSVTMSGSCQDDKNYGIMGVAVKQASTEVRRVAPVFFQ